MVTRSAQHSFTRTTGIKGNLLPLYSLIHISAWTSLNQGQPISNILFFKRKRFPIVEHYNKL